MKICAVQSSYEGTGSIFEANDSMPDPGYYADKTYHQFERRYIRKFAEKADIDAICAEKFDMYMNFMWGQLNDNVAGVEATRYLESKGVPVVLNPSDYISKTKADFQDAAKKGGFLVPSNTPGKFPKIVKYLDGLASIGMDYNSICYSDDEVTKRVALLQKQEPTREAMVQDFIRGIESTAIVVEMGSDVVALEPVDWIFDPKTPVDKAWLTYSNKFEALGEGSIHFQFVTEEPRRTNIQKAAVAAFKGLGMQGHGAWGRVDVRCEQNTGDVYCLEMNHMPALFYGANDKLSDDVIIRETFPGGHEAFIEVLLFTKKFQMAQSAKPLNGVNGHANKISSQPIGDLKASGTTIAEVYDSAVDNYDNMQAGTNIRAWQLKYFAEHDYSGTVLDLACGTGGIGMVIHKTSPDAVINGIDVSALSLKSPQIVKHYVEPLRVGFLQDEIMRIPLQSYDHVVCFGALHFLNRTEFMASFSRMFMVARKSVALDVDDVYPEYIDAIISCFGEGLRNHNNVEAMKRFGVPPGWKKTVDEVMPLFYSPSVHMDVPGHVLRFERI